MADTAKTKKTLKQELEDIADEIAELEKKQKKLENEAKIAGKKTASFYVAYDKAREAYEAEKKNETPDEVKLKSLKEKMDEKQNEFDAAKKESDRLKVQIDKIQEELDELDDEEDEKKAALAKLDDTPTEEKKEPEAKETKEKEKESVKQSVERPHWTKLRHFGFEDDRSLEDKINSFQKVLTGSKVKFQQLGKDKHIFDLEMPNGDTYMIDVKDNKVMLNSANMSPTLGYNFLIATLQESGAGEIKLYPEDSNLHNMEKAMILDVATKRGVLSDAPTEVKDTLIKMEELKKSSAIQELVESPEKFKPF